MIKKNDFIEIDFIASVKETNSIFDTTLPEEAEKAGLFQDKERDKEKFKPIKICVGQGMVVQGLDKVIENKEIGKWHEAELQPKEAYGERDAKLVKIMPIRIFKEKGIMPAAGMMLTLDNLLVRIAAVSSGRVIVDFNNPLSGKNIIYKFRIDKKIDDNKEKLEILAGLFLGKPETVKIENNKGIVEFFIKVPEPIEKEFSKKVKEILGLEIEIREAKQEEESEKFEEGKGKKEKQKKAEEKIKVNEEYDGKMRTERPYNE
jgi:FKBP-type peptidyl-prolyl cis-trans isomerase 2